MIKERIVIATIKSWNVKNGKKLKKLLFEKYNISILSKKNELTFDTLNIIKPKYVFFPHWSWIIPEEIYKNFKCIVFHMTDLPYGRGGSPLQNLIINKKYNTKISAINVEKNVDSGDIYLKKDFCIKTGRAQQIFQRLSKTIFFKLIPYILEHNPIPYKQKGETIPFKRRKPEQSNIQNAQLNSLADFYDFIRMLDGEGYPKSFIKVGNFNILFSKINKKQNTLEGKFEIIETHEKPN
jgi:methionyl-tRNA formyltransferase